MGEISASIINPGINQYKLLINEEQRYVAAKNQLLMPLHLLKWHAAYHRCSITSYKIFRCKSGIFSSSTVKAAVIAQYNLRLELMCVECEK